MCNARNHPSYCRCGFGGDGHKGRSVGFVLQGTKSRTPAIPKLASGYTVPNCSCPYCSSPVFFYESPSGGRVFFDELGPPWPKHFCLSDSTGSIPKIRRHQISAPFRWQVDGWQPFFFMSSMVVNAALLIVVGKFQDRVIQVYLLKRDIESDSSSSDLLRCSLIQMRVEASKIYSLELFTPDCNVIKTTGYTSIEAAPTGA